MDNHTDTQDHSTLLFREVQYNRQVLPWAIITVISILMAFVLIWQVILGNTFGSNPAPDIVIIIFFIIFGLGLPSFFATMNLTIEVRCDGLYYRFFPFHMKFHRIDYKTLKNAKICIYNPLAEYGGWGIRFGIKGMAYNVSGNMGVQLTIEGRSPLLIGSRRSEELILSLNKLNKR